MIRESRCYRSSRKSHCQCDEVRPSSRRAAPPFLPQMTGNRSTAPYPVTVIWGCGCAKAHPHRRRRGLSLSERSKAGANIPRGQPMPLSLWERGWGEGPLGGHTSPASAMNLNLPTSLAPHPRLPSSNYPTMRLSNHQTIRLSDYRTIRLPSHIWRAPPPTAPIPWRMYHSNPIRISRRAVPVPHRQRLAAGRSFRLASPSSPDVATFSPRTLPV